MTTGKNRRAMKNKVRLIDVNIVSSYMGRFLTVIVTVAVLAITVSALVSDGGNPHRRTLVLGVAADGNEPEYPEHFEPLKAVLARESGRLVELRRVSTNPEPACELYVMPAVDFLERDYDGQLVPVYSICALAGGRDNAVLLSRPGWQETDLSSLAASDVVFARPASGGCFWLQLEALEARGFTPPADLRDLRFAPGPRVVLEVMTGGCKLGACRQRDVLSLLESGALRDGDVAFVQSIPAPPDQIFACRKGDVEYFTKLLQKVATSLADARPPAAADETILLLKAHGIRSLRPVATGEMGAVGELLSRNQSRNTFPNL